MNALVTRKAKSNLSFILICRSLTTVVGTHNGRRQDGCDLSRALARCHLFGRNEFDWFHGLQRAFERPGNHESNPPRRWVTQGNAGQSATFFENHRAG